MTQSKPYGKKGLSWHWCNRGYGNRYLLPTAYWMKPYGIRTAESPQFLPDRSERHWSVGVKWWKWDLSIKRVKIL